MTIFKLTVDGKTDNISAIVLKKKKGECKGLKVVLQYLSIVFNMVLNIVNESQQSESVSAQLNWLNRLCRSQQMESHLSHLCSEDAQNNDVFLLIRDVDKLMLLSGSKTKNTYAVLILLLNKSCVSIENKHWPKEFLIAQGHK